VCWVFSSSPTQSLGATPCKDKSHLLRVTAGFGTPVGLQWALWQAKGV
jgi:hypothetical protein